MDDAALREELDYLGIDQNNLLLVAVLPLIEVAWADGRIRPGEREVVLAAAERHAVLDDRGREVLESWLHDRPSGYYLQRGRRVLLALADRPDNAVDLEMLDEVGAFCEGVARATGGLFGLRGIADEERKAIDDIVEALAVDRSMTWEELRRTLRG